MTTQKFSESDTKIAFIGCGNMASAIINGLVKAGWPANQIMASNPSQGKLDHLQKNLKIQTTNDNLEAAAFADIIVLSVKPQKLADVCSLLKNYPVEDKLIISVAAGFPANKIAASLQQSPAIIRAMPNTPALIGKGASGLFAIDSVTQNQKEITESIFNAVGETCWIEKESQMDIVTAIAGSSPAYVFLMMEAMVEQATASGLKSEDAFKLVTQAVSGAAQLAQQTPEKSLATLRKEVTSPGGTTAAAITSFKADNFEPIITKAVRASIQRGKELGNQS